MIQLESNVIAVYIIISLSIFSIIVLTGVVLLFTYLSDFEPKENYESINHHDYPDPKRMNETSTLPMTSEFEMREKMMNPKYIRRISSMTEDTSGEFCYYNLYKDYHCPPGYSTSDRVRSFKKK